MAAAHGKAGATVGLFVVAVGQNERRQPKTPRVRRQFFRRRGHHVRGQHGRPHTRVMIADLLLGQVLRANAIDDRHARQVRLEHEIVHIEDDAGAGAARQIDCRRYVLVPSGAPDDENVGVSDLVAAVRHLVGTHP